MWATACSSAQQLSGSAQRLGAERDGRGGNASTQGRGNRKARRFGQRTESQRCVAQRVGQQQQSTSVGARAAIALRQQQQCTGVGEIAQRWEHSAGGDRKEEHSDCELNAKAGGRCACTESTAQHNRAEHTAQIMRQQQRQQSTGSEREKWQQPRQRVVVQPRSKAIQHSGAGKSTARACGHSG